MKISTYLQTSPTLTCKHICSLHFLSKQNLTRNKSVRVHVSVFGAEGKVEEIEAIILRLPWDFVSLNMTYLTCRRYIYTSSLLLQRKQTYLKLRSAWDIASTSVALWIHSDTHRPYEHATTDPVAFHETLVTCRFWSWASGYDNVCKHNTWKRSNSSTEATISEHREMRSVHTPAYDHIVTVLASPLSK